ncbi:DUF4352 domain-containing protein [Psychrobacillus sp. NEAU-3TGS]|uniref:DUF4352 domain-containing protein n=1 Tax=Psychrobacillus sp. NEAU-3TGS TaxID=2995412 RepID=UPI002496F576|nr:DUF4352 domain-containing protein [Psychrobacillus sp. NEAU-3TGS]MDI2588042.1 DUF4352 domain-containing protein [Psychrobacillus sp. NEAU-3TGS]
MKKFFKIGCLGIIVLFILLIIIGALLGDDSQNKNGDSSEKEKFAENIETTAEVKNISIGDDLSVGKVVFKVNSIEETKQITAGNGMFKYSPEAEGAVFLIVNVTVKNDDVEMIQTDSSFFKLIAENDAKYSPSRILVADDKYFVYEGINPGLSLTGNIVFEVPSGLTGLDLQVKLGNWGSKSGLINLN